MVTLANGSYLSMEKVLSERVGDCFSYLQYVAAKAEAEQAQREYDEKMMKSRRKK